MPFKVHDDLAIPGRIVNRSLSELVSAISDLEVGSCLEVNVQDLNWADYGPGFRPKRENVARKLVSARQTIKRHHKNRMFTIRPITQESVGIWRIADKHE